ncbi:uncharacterized protein CLUP02_12533 [Colletotrichum lupini]|uniref:Uncharacterized protein n=1 Tax=Colletotrichum lupini TaxID=145971 RepID=A0A9Q8T0N8_9PEZI|nr:uncharacterized protein CLUP02_12533 [Colletotrichum lupini]UQC87031.1 hypothetical protein CLUP02_12533 [Colletotrichum lupini]
MSSRVYICYAASKLLDSVCIHSGGSNTLILPQGMRPMVFNSAEYQSRKLFCIEKSIIQQELCDHWVDTNIIEQLC